MSAWVLIPSLVALRAEFNLLAPGRDKGADGSIGDSSHTSTSDHSADEDSDYLRDHDADSKNEVHALDIDSTGPWPRLFNSIVLAIVAAERKRWLDPNDRCRLKYVIWNRRIYSQTTDFEARDYTGSDPHTNHAHFSGRYETACENDTSPWGVYVAAPPKPAPAPQPEEDDGMADITSARFNELMNAYLNGPGGALMARKLLSYDPGYNADGKTTPNGAVKNLTTDDPSNPTVGPATALERAQVAAVLGYQIRAGVDALLAAVDLLTKSVAAGETADAADRQAVLSAVSAAKDAILAEIAEPPAQS